MERALTSLPAPADAPFRRVPNPLAPSARRLGTDACDDSGGAALRLVAGIIKTAVSDLRSRCPAQREDAEAFLTDRTRTGPWLALVGLDGRTQRRILTLERQDLPPDLGDT